MFPNASLYLFSVVLLRTCSILRFLLFTIPAVSRIAGKVYCTFFLYVPSYIERIQQPKYTTADIVFNGGRRQTRRTFYRFYLLVFFFSPRCTHTNKHRTCGFNFRDGVCMYDTYIYIYIGFLFVGANRRRYVDFRCTYK